MAVKRQAKKEPAKKAAPSRSSRKSGGEEETSSGMSKADIFDKTKATGSVDAGKYEAIIDEFVLQKPNEKGQSARIKFKIASEGDAQGQTATQWYKMFEADETAAKGLEFLKKDLAILGYDDVKFGELEDVFEEITDQHPGVVLTVVHKDGFVNCYIGGLCEDSAIIDEFKANNPY